MLAARTEELLSYLIGLGPVGQEIEFQRNHVRQDLRMSNFYKHLNILIAAGYVRRLYCGYRGTSGLLVVLRRYEPGATTCTN